MREIRGSRYLTAENRGLANYIQTELPYLDFKQAVAVYDIMDSRFKDEDRALLGCNDRFYLLTRLLHRKDVENPWLFLRCREVESNTDGHLDLWARFHYKSTIGTFGGGIQEILCNPEITIGIFSHTKDIAEAFLTQIMQEFENNEDLKRIYSDVLWFEPRKEAPIWGVKRGIVVKRKSNPKESTVEAHGLVDGQPVSRHFDLMIYDDVVVQASVTNPEQIRKTTFHWELSDNLASHRGARKWHFGSRYSFADTYGIILERGTLKARIHAATDDGTLNGSPVFLTDKRWKEIKDTQRSTVAAQMLLNPVAGNEAIFRAGWLKSYEIRPSLLNIYMLIDPSLGKAGGDRTAIAVIGYDQSGNIYLLDGVRHRMRLTDRWQFMKSFYNKWHDQYGVQSFRCGYERYGMQTDIEVLQEKQEEEKINFLIEELNWPRMGGTSKVDRVQRLEPDMRKGRFYLPALVYHPDLEFGGKDNLAIWSVGDEGENKDKIIYRPLREELKIHKAMDATGQSYRKCSAIRRIDEDRNIYDLSRAFIEEMVFFPFSPKDDLIDVVSRIYDMKPVRPVIFEKGSLEPVAHPDS